MKTILKLSLLMIALVALVITSGCGKNNFEGTWIGYDGDKTMYRLTVQENGDSYLIREDAYTYKPSKDYPTPAGYFPSFIRNENKSKNVTFDINFVLTKQKADLTNATAQLNKDKDQLIVGKGLGNVHFIEKDSTLLFNGIRFKKETSQDITNNVLKQLQFAMNQELKVKYHQYGKRGLNNLRDHVTLGNITFDDSALTATK